MYKALLVFVLGFAFSLSSAFAQALNPKIGIGISLNPIALFSSGSTSMTFLPVGLTNLYLPVDMSKSLRLEPEVGIYSTSAENSYSGTAYSPAYSTKSSGSITRFGFGIFYLMPADTSFHTYVGPRIGLLLTSSELSTTLPHGTTITSDETDVFVGLAIGGEYMFSSHFSLGGEAQLNYIGLGEPSVSPASATNPTENRHMITNNGLVFIRWYF